MMESPKNENLTPGLSKTIEGHPPLTLIRREGEIFTEDGRRLMSDFKIGPEQHHIDLFCEYERTFGRGKAFAITHHPISGGIYADARKEYQELTGLIASTVFRGTKEECEKFIERIKGYRDKHPALFGDVEINRPSRGPIKWRNLNATDGRE